MKNKQTAVEWLIEQLETFVTLDEELTWDKLFEQAKQMEKEQIVEAFDCDGTPQPGEVWISNGEQYYSETYNK